MHRLEHIDRCSASEREKSISRGIYYRVLSVLTGLTGFAGSEPLVRILASARMRSGPGHSSTYLGHLGRIFPERTPDELNGLLYRYWQTHERAILGLFLAGRLNRDNFMDRTAWEGREVLDDAVADGRGVILLTPHFGDERMLHILLAIAGYPIHVISSRYSDAPAAVRRARLTTSMRWHHVGFPDEHPGWIYRALRSGEVVQIAPTAWGGPKGHWVSSFGVPVLSSSTAVRIARTTGCRLVAAWNHVLPGMRYRPCFRSFSPQHLDGTASEELFGLYGQLGREHPEQYCWMNLTIRHRETNTMGRLGYIPVEERVLEENAIEGDWDPRRILDPSRISSLTGKPPEA